MFILFHIFIPLLSLEIFIRFNKSKDEFLHRFSLIIGSILPDLIDKPLSFISEDFGGRGYAHTLIFLLFVTILTHLLRKDNKITISLLMGLIFHLILDLPNIPLFWPFQEINLYNFELYSWIETLLHNPLIFFTELFSFIGLIIISIRYKIIFNQKIINGKNLKIFLFESPKMIKNMEN